MVVVVGVVSVVVVIVVVAFCWTTLPCPTFQVLGVVNDGYWLLVVAGSCW